MASIRRRKTKDGVSRYDVLWREGGKQTSAVFDDARAAKHWKDLLHEHGPEEAALIAGREKREPRWRSTTVTAWGHTYIDNLTGVQNGTKNRYRRYVELDIASTIGSISVPVLTHFDVTGWVAAMDTSPKTISNKLSFFSSAMKGAIRNRLRADNPCEGVRAPRCDRHDAVFL